MENMIFIAQYAAKESIISHAGEAYISLAASVVLDTSHSESPFKPCETLGCK